ncbi:MAG TPA: hypothetical protein VHQ03_06640, partial [Candidatus Dormibacteraeota bacterium]|nr:hypothetical protein [Candidatus Dormibacteraeota bacterium]
EHAVEPGTVRTSGALAGRVLVACIIAALVFTAGFDYFGRPALVIQGLYNQHELGSLQAFASYSLGQPTRTLGTVTYPIRARNPTQVCDGTITLVWDGLFGWQPSGMQLMCEPS